MVTLSQNVGRHLYGSGDKMMFDAGIHRVSEIQMNAIVRACEQAGWRIFRLPPNIIDKRTFFYGIAQTFPLDPPLERYEKWEALSDSLWSGLDELDEDRIVVIWPDAFRMATSDPRAFDIAQSIFAELVRSLGDPEITVGTTKTIVIFEGEA